MNRGQLQFAISPEVTNLGVTGVYLVIEGMQNRERDAEFDSLRQQSFERLKADYSDDFIERDRVLQGFRRLHTKVGCSNRKFVSSPENLIKILLRQLAIPTVNLIVDIYNYVSLETRLALGSHDLSKIDGNVTLRLSNGSERFVPLGSEEIKPVKSGEYCYIDDSNEILCRLEYRQVEKTRITLETTDCFFIVQGNEATSPEYLKKGMEQLIMLARRYCGGQERVLWSP
ncbi:MAG: phenylalanine--tRNA ligase beta subunit-related protein [Bacteroidota bacterium]